MKRQIVITIVLFVTTFAVSARAEKKGDILRGGFGLLFADTNQLVNPGQMALNKGFAIEANGSMQDVSGVNNLTVGPSFAWGNGSVALGGSYVRSGSDLFADGAFTSRVTGVAGLAFGKGKATLGASYATDLDAATATGGDVGLNFNVNGGSGKGRGIIFGVAGTMNTETLVKGATGALGFAFMRGAGIEANFKLNDVEAFDDWELSGHVLMGGKSHYIGFGYTHENLTAAGEVNARAGLVLGKVDFSAFIKYPTSEGASPTYGATFRATF